MTVSAAQVFEEIRRIGREDLQLARPVARGDRLLQDLAARFDDLHHLWEWPSRTAFR